MLSSPSPCAELFKGVERGGVNGGVIIMGCCSAATLKMWFSLQNRYRDWDMN